MECIDISNSCMHGIATPKLIDNPNSESTIHLHISVTLVLVIWLIAGSRWLSVLWSVLGSVVIGRLTGWVARSPGCGLARVGLAWGIPVRRLTGWGVGSPRVGYRCRAI